MVINTQIVSSVGLFFKVIITIGTFFVKLKLSLLCVSPVTITTTIMIITTITLTKTKQTQWAFDAAQGAWPKGHGPRGAAPCIG